MESKFIWKDGELVEFEKATVHMLTAALHYGAAVFEGIRAYKTDKGPAIFRLKEHTERLLKSAEIFGFRDLPYTVEGVAQAMKDTVKANGFDECYIRPLLYLTAAHGTSTRRMQASTDDCCLAVVNYLGERRWRKASVRTFHHTRHHPNVSMTKAKIAGNYVNSILAKTESVRLGFEEAIMLDPQGYVAECTGENLFVVRRGKVITPATAPVLEGITRHTVHTIAKDLGYGMLEDPISRDQLYAADECLWRNCGSDRS
jgi:branched-chain amino acid aminotransferase